MRNWCSDKFSVFHRGKLFFHVRLFDFFSVFLLLSVDKMTHLCSNSSYLQLLEFINEKLMLCHNLAQIVVQIKVFYFRPFLLFLLSYCLVSFMTGLVGC